MAGTAETVRSLTREDAQMEDAIETVLDAAERNGEIEWGDVNDDLTSGQWGRLIEKGVLVDGRDGFVLDDPEAVREALSDDEPEPPEEDSSWSKWDKLAGLVSLSLFPGYYIGWVREMVGSALNVFFGPLNEVLPFYAVIMVLAVITGFNSTVIQDNLMDMEKMSYYQQRMKDLQSREQEAKERDDDEAIEEIRQEQLENMGENLGMFKEQFRPMAWIMLFTIPIFLWMYWVLGSGQLPAAETTLVMPLAGEANLNGGIGSLPFPAWIVWYFLCSMSFTQIIRKALNVQTTPT
jgi:uncharacterized membrane protein (DUF106 family)